MRRSSRTFNPGFGTFLEERRTALGITRTEFALRAGVSPAYLREMLHGLVPSPDRVADMARGLGEDPEDWLRAAKQDGHEVSSSPVAQPLRARVRVQSVLRGNVVQPIRAYQSVEVLLGRAAGESEGPTLAVLVETEAASPLLRSGDVLLVDDSVEAEEGDLVLAQLEGDRQLIGWLTGEREGAPVVQPVTGKARARRVKAVVGSVIQRVSGKAVLRAARPAGGRARG